MNYISSGFVQNHVINILYTLHINNNFLLQYRWFTMLWLFLLCSKVIQFYIYIHSFSYSCPLWFITGYWIYFPVLYSRTLLFIHSIYKSLHLLTPISHSIPPPTPLLGNHNFSLCLWNCFCFIDNFIHVIVQIPHVSDICYLSFSVWLTSLSMIISSPIHE